MQNFALREFSVLQEEQRRVNGDAHSPQNFARSGFSAPHFEQRIADPQMARKTVQTKFVSGTIASVDLGPLKRPHWRHFQEPGPPKRRHFPAGMVAH
jgi:hypothetical protein